MALHTEEGKETGGNRKKINAGARAMIFDNLQRGNYKYPIKSTVRELVANGVDAIKERKNAIAILNGSAKVTDFYYTPGTNPELDESIEKNPDLYTDSNFDPTYYDPRYLEKVEDSVAILYVENSVLNRDVLIIKDSGVGLKGSRLEGYLELAYSTKRLNPQALGKFGLGSKVALSMGSPYFTAVSRHNGEEIVFNIYSEHYESTVPPMNLATGEKHIRHVMINDDDTEYVYYSRKTDKKNGTEIHTQVKKHHKADILSAVQNELLYFPNVTLQVVDEEHVVKQAIPVQAEILYEDEFVVIPNNSPFSKPHIVVNGVNYGYLDWLEMELEEKVGGIGIKVSPTEVEVSHSREDINYVELTKATVVRRVKGAKDIAGNFISKQLVEKDYVRWLKLCHSVMSHGLGNADSNESKVIKAFSGFCDIKELSFAYSVRPHIKYGNSNKSAAPFSLIHRITRSQVRKGEDWVQKLNREPVTSMHWDVDVTPIFVKEDKYSFRKDMYLTSIYSDGYFVISSPKPTTDSEELEFNAILRAEVVDPYEKFNLIKGSSGVLSWDDVVVPESFSIKDEDEDKEVVAKVKDAVVSVKERRKLEGKIVGFTPRVCNSNDHSSRNTGKYLYENHRVELKPADVDDSVQMYYGTQEYDVLLYLAASLTRPVGDSRFTTMDRDDARNQEFGWRASQLTAWGEGANIHLLQISKDNEAYFAQDWAHITTFFSSIDNGIITMDNQLIKWNTARIVNNYVTTSLRFLHNYSAINSEISDTYKVVYDYYIANYIDYKQLISNGYVHSTMAIFDSLLDHMNKVTELHVLCASGAEDAAIGSKAMTLFPEDPNAGDIKGAVGVDLEIYAKLMQLVEYAEPINIMLNMNSKLCGNASLSMEEELEIKAYIKSKTESH
jgi:hypothetical protein